MPVQPSFPMTLLYGRLRRWMWLPAALLFLLAPGRASAQEARTITFNEAVQIALDQNIALRRSVNNVELQSIDVARQRNAFLPNLNFSTDGGLSNGRNFDLNAGGFVTETTSSLRSSISSNVNLFNGFGDVASLEQARLQRDASNLDYERQRQTVVFTVMSNYLELINQREQVSIQQENLEAQQQLLTQIEEFTRVGSRPISDLYQQQAAVASAELSLLQAERRVRLSELALIQTLQLDPFGTYDFSLPEVGEAVLVPNQYDARAMLRDAFDRRYDLQAQQQSIQAAAQGIRAARSGYWPSINLSGNASFRYTDARDDADFSTQFFDERNSSFGVGLSFPIFDRFLTRNSVQQARVQFQNARLDLENLQQDIALQVRQSYLDYLQDEKRLQVTEVQLRSAQQALDAEQERYNVGASTLVELSQARANFVQASSDRASAVYDFIFRKKLIDYYVGVLDPARPLFR